MHAGKLDRRVVFRKRAEVGGMHTGELVDHLTCWAAWRPMSARAIVEAGGAVDAVGGSLVIRDSSAARAIAREDRAVFGGSDLHVASAPIPDRSGFLRIDVTRQAGGT